MENPNPASPELHQELPPASVVSPARPQLPLAIVAAGVGVIILVAGVIGYYVGQRSLPSPDPDFVSPPIVKPSTPASGDEGVFCTMDAMQCPDGSYVGRTGPNCEFVCPGETNENTN